MAQPTPLGCGSVVKRTSLASPSSVFGALLGAAATAVLALGSRLTWAGPAVVATPLAAAAAIRRPSPALYAGWIAVIFVPVYWGIQLTPGLALVPITAVCLVLLPAAAASLSHVRLGIVDALVISFFGTQAVAYLLNFESGASSAVGLLSRSMLGYAVVRALSLLSHRRRSLAVLTIVCGVLLGVMAHFEARGIPNPLFALRRGFEAEVWARPELRFGGVRAETTFGHPIAFGLFLAHGLILAFALSTTKLRSLAPYLGAIGVIGSAMLTTVSRTPIVLAGAGIVLLALGARQRQRAVLAPVICVLLAAVALSPAASRLSDLAGSLQGQSQAADSAEYRVRLLAVATEPDNFSLFGRFSGVKGAGSVNGVAQVIGFPSFDNYFALVYLVTGAVPLALLLLLCGFLWREALARKVSPADRGWACAAASATLGLLAVGLLAQYGDILWLNIALVASARQERLLGPAGDLEPVAVSDVAAVPAAA